MDILAQPLLQLLRQVGAAHERVQRIDLEPERCAIRVERRQLADDRTQSDGPQKRARQHDERANDHLQRVGGGGVHVAVADGGDRRHRKVKGPRVRPPEAQVDKAVCHVLVLGDAAILVAEPSVAQIGGDTRLQPPDARDVVRVHQHLHDGPEDVEHAVVDRMLHLPSNPQPRAAQKLEHFRQAERAEDAQELDLRGTRSGVAEGDQVERERDDDRERVETEPRRQVVARDRSGLVDPDALPLLALVHDEKLQDQLDGKDAISHVVHEEERVHLASYRHECHLKRRGNRDIDEGGAGEQVEIVEPFAFARIDDEPWRLKVHRRDELEHACLQLLHVRVERVRLAKLDRRAVHPPLRLPLGLEKPYTILVIRWQHQVGGLPRQVFDVLHLVDEGTRAGRQGDAVAAVVALLAAKTHPWRR
eukprot:3652175-Prymnesium_polylepis.2